MALVGDTGNGATLALTTQTAAAALKIDKITIGELSLDMLEVSTLSTSGVHERIGSDLQKAADIVVDYVYSASATAITISGAVDTCTISFPVGAAQTTTTPATYVCTGLVTKIKPPELANGAVMKGSFTFSPDGDTGPTYTRGS